MLSKSIAQHVRSLHQKKFRQQHGQFLVEGAKSVAEVLASDFRVEWLLATEGFHKETTPAPDHQSPRREILQPDELTRIGTLESNNAAIAVVRMPDAVAPAPLRPGQWALVLDDLRDPGNLGTVIRIADWYGIEQIICSETTVDVYNPKVISATKGSFTRVLCHYVALPALLAEQRSAQPNVAILGMFLGGENLHRATFPQEGGFVVIGNEASGISEAVARYVTRKLTIPRFGGAESLNAAVATAVVLDNIQRVKG